MKFKPGDIVCNKESPDGYQYTIVKYEGIHGGPYIDRDDHRYSVKFEPTGRIYPGVSESIFMLIRERQSTYKRPLPDWF